jgi:hypothetical protein
MCIETRPLPSLRDFGDVNVLYTLSNIPAAAATAGTEAQSKKLFLKNFNIYA